jgi:hypothetical protein
MSKSLDGNILDRECNDAFITCVASAFGISSKRTIIHVDRVDVIKKIKN